MPLDFSGPHARYTVAHMGHNVVMQELEGMLWPVYGYGYGDGDSERREIIQRIFRPREIQRLYRQKSYNASSDHGRYDSHPR